MTLKAFQYRIQPALILDLGDGVVMPFQYIPPGSFWMGSRGYNPFEEPKHRVTITQPFYLGTFPVTQEQFAKWRSNHQNYFPARPNNPVEQIDWRDACLFCEWLNDDFGHQLPTNHIARLPTEAQWEIACRAGTETDFYSGDGEAALGLAGWYSDNAKSQTQQVGTLTGNDFGLHDMHGNVWEWCVDAWDGHAYKKRMNDVRDPFVKGNKGSLRCMRGGSWKFLSRSCRTAIRSSAMPAERYSFLGFRVCIAVNPCAIRTALANWIS